MLKTLTYTALTVLLSGTVAAQTKGTAPQGDTSPNDSSTSKSQKLSMTGCISENDGKYMLMSKDRPSGIELTSAQDLKPHVGHTVTLTGSMQDSANTANPANQGLVPSSKERDANKTTTLQVNSLKMVSTTCSTGNSDASGTSNKTGTGGTKPDTNRSSSTK